MVQLLTKRKEKWANTFKPDILRGPVLNHNVANEMRYYRRLAALIEKMTAHTKKQLIALFNEDHAEEYFAMDASIASQARILTNALTSKFDDLFASLAKPMAEDMIDDVNKSSKQSLTQSLKELSGGLTIPVASINNEMKEILSATITENVGLITNIPAKYMTNIQGAVMRSITSGNGLKDLVPAINKQKGITLRRARLIAADQTSKAYSNLNAGRMQNVGIEEYEWRHTPGSRYPRHEHEEMNGNIYSFKKPPVIDSKTGERGIPGQLIHCNCRMMPVIRFKGEK